MIGYIIAGIIGALLGLVIYIILEWKNKDWHL